MTMLPPNSYGSTNMNDMLTTKALAERTGYSQEAIRMKVKSGVWIRNKHYVKAPDGRLIFIVEMIHQWFKGE